MEPLIVFHYGCMDGLGALWAARSVLRNAEVWGGSYGGKLPPDELLAGRDVVIVDFSFPLDQLREMASKARSVLVLDHHATAEQALSELPNPNEASRNWGANYSMWAEYVRAGTFQGSNLAALFDMERSGAGITWDFFHPGEARPRIIDLIEDRDLWRFKYGADTRAFDAVMRLWDLTKWETAVSYLGVLDMWSKDGDKAMWATEMAQGAAILKFQEQAVEAMIATSMRWLTIAGVSVPIVNCPGQFASEVGNNLVKAFPAARFAGSYYDSNDGFRHFSLRSAPEGDHVGNICVALGKRTGFNGGGGHPHAAGFNAPFGWEGEPTDGGGSA